MVAKRIKSWFVFDPDAHLPTKQRMPQATEPPAVAQPPG
jgi:hypothetical protein